MKAIKFLISIIFLVTTSCLQVQKPNDFKKKLLKLDELLKENVSDDGVGMSIIITHKNQIIYEKYMGYANLDQKEKLNPDHVLGIASMSKQFLGMATLILIQEGKIDLSKDIREYLPDLPVNDRKIRIEQLLSHTSGLPELTENDEFMNNISNKHTIEQIIEIALKGEYRSDPGERYIYCNTGYTIMTELIEKQSGMNFAAFLRKNIFEPLEMSKTYSCDFNQDALNAVQRYYLDSTGYNKATVMHFSNLIGGGAVISNVQDMAKWNIALLSGKNLPDNHFEIWNPILLNSGESTGYGLGMGVSSLNGKTFYYHPGTGDGMSAINLIFPEDKISITVIQNVYPPKFSSNEIALTAAEYLFENE